jgi:hypothetical protein
MKPVPLLRRCYAGWDGSGRSYAKWICRKVQPHGIIITMSLALRSLLELRALLDSLKPNYLQGTSKPVSGSGRREMRRAASLDSLTVQRFDERSSAPEHAVLGLLRDDPPGVPVNTESTSSRILFSDT